MAFKYHKVRTSAEFQIKEYIKMLTFSGIQTGSKFIIDKTDYVQKVVQTSNDNAIYEAKKSKFAQNILCWEALGFIKEISVGEYIVIHDDIDIEILFEKSKIVLTQPHHKKKIEHFRKTKVTNVLFNSLIINFPDIKYRGLEGYKSSEKNKLTEEQIHNEIGKYEKFISKDSYMLEKYKEVYKNA